MTNHPNFPLLATTTVPGVVYPAIQMALRHEAISRDLNLLCDTDTETTVELVRGLMSFGPIDQGVSVTVRAATPEWLQMLKERLVERLSATAAETVEGLRWSDAEQAGIHPPNLHFAEVLSVEPVGLAFLRVRAQAEDLSSFQDDAIHFRLLLPAKGRVVTEWPSLAANGSTVWPKGDAELHRPVYTVRTVDRETSIFEFDVFLHDGGRVTAWASNVRPGVRFGIMGPSGAGVPETDRILAFADETAFPAIARILEALPQTSTGSVTLLTDNGAGCAYPFPTHEGMSVRWVSREDGVDLVERALAAHQDHPDYFLWFAGERGDVLDLRAAYKSREGDPSLSYIASYWSGASRP